MPGADDRLTGTAADLRVALENPVPASLPVGRSTAIFCYGTCYHRSETVEDLAVVVDGVRHRPDAKAMPRLDIFYALHPQPLRGPDDPASPHDPGVRAYRSGFWATVPVAARAHPGTVDLRVAARLGSGAELEAPLGRIDVVQHEPPRAHGAGPGLIAVCMATFDPELTLFRIQIESLRAQTDERWICLISDDCSDPRRFDELTEVVDNDERFVVSRSERRLGFYRNFERALAMVPPDAELVALCDQDDRWQPAKLQVLRDSLGAAHLVYSDQRLVDVQGNVLSDTNWKGRRNNHTDIASLLIANSISGAAMLFRRQVVDVALPFPEAPGLQFHDHWLGLVALAMGDVAYIDRPLYDYVQHASAVLGKVWQETPTSPTERRSWRAVLKTWRVAYFWGYLGREVQAHTLLARCSSCLTSRKRRALRRFIASARSPIAFAWLVVRPLRSLLGRNETLGSELDLVVGIMWRWLVTIRAVGLRVPGRRSPDTSYPLDMTFEQKRLRRWRERL